MSAIAEPVSIQRIDTQELEAEINPLLTRAKSIVVNSPEACEDASNFLRDVKGARNRIQEWFAPLVEAAHKAHKALTSRRGEVDLPLASAEATVKNKLALYHTEQERIRRAEEDRLRREAEARERERVEAERRRIAEERAALERAALEEAARLEAAGKADEAEALVQSAIEAPPEPEPIYVPPPPVFIASAAPKVQGVTTRKVWRFRVTDFAKLPNAYKVANEQAIGAQVRSLGQQHGIPGVEAYEETTVAASGR